MEQSERKIKCVIWDLDNTIWDGVLLEDEYVTLRDRVGEVIDELDNRGILQSISSKNDNSLATAQLKEYGLYDYFLFPQINWNPKSISVKKIVDNINIAMDTVAFVDDQAFERDEVKHSLPEVLCLDAADIPSILEMPEMMPRFITDESRLRRKMYLDIIKRDREEAEYQGTKEDFLASLNIKLTIAAVTENDLKRAEELTLRTHQLNSTGYTYSYEELDAYRKSKDYRLLIADLDDRYGTYGKIGLALIECKPDRWTIKLLLMSCRVISRGVGTIMLNYIRNLAKKAGVKLYAEFLSNDRNEMMYITYKLTGFSEVEEKDNMIIFVNNLAEIPPHPEYIDLKADT